MTAIANIAKLKAPSEGLLILLFPSLRKLRELLKQGNTRQDFWTTLLKDPQVHKELERLAKAVKSLARPLSEAKDADKLERALETQLPTYLIWKHEFFALLLGTLS